MPKERSIAKRLSGGEALDSLCHQIRVKLAPSFRNPADLDRLMKGIWGRLCRHEHFHSHKGYHGYSATVNVSLQEMDALIEVTFRPAMSYAPPLTDNFVIPGNFQASDLTIEIPVRPPNVVRTEASMPLPVQVEEQGQVIEKIVPAAKYKGKLKPGNRMPVTANTDMPAFKGRLEMPEGVAVQQRG